MGSNLPKVIQVVCGDGAVQTERSWNLVNSSQMRPDLEGVHLCLECLFTKAMNAAQE